MHRRGRARRRSRRGARRVAQPGDDRPVQRSPATRARPGRTGSGCRLLVVGGRRAAHRRPHAGRRTPRGAAAGPRGRRSGDLIGQRWPRHGHPRRWAGRPVRTLVDPAPAGPGRGRRAGARDPGARPGRADDRRRGRWARWWSACAPRRRGAGHRGAHRRAPLVAGGCSARRSPRRTPTRRHQPPSAWPLTWLSDQARWRDVGFLCVLGDRRLRDVRPVGAAGRRRRDVPHDAVLARLVVAGPARARSRCWLAGLVDAGVPVPRPALRASATSSAARESRQLRAPGRGGRPRPAPRRSTTRPPRCAGSSATCTTAPQARLGVGRHERRPRREADAERPRGGRRAAARGPRDDGRRARRPALGRARHPPAGARRPRAAGAIEALALPIPLPVTVVADVPERLPDPVESAAYFAVAECLANTVKHAGATRVTVARLPRRRAPAARRRRRRPRRRRPDRAAG